MPGISRLSPGIELNEIDRSGYGITDYSITGTTVFICGFANRGEDYTPQWVNTMATFESLYGEPTNEVEMYLWMSAREVLDNGGICIISKLPYDNEQKDRFTSIRYHVSDNIITGDSVINQLSSIDSSITAYMKIQPSGFDSNISMESLDGYRTNAGAISRNDIIIIDVSRRDYGKMNIIGSDGFVLSDDVECLGIMPVITTPVNAMFYQQIISSQTSCGNDGVEYTFGLSDYMPIESASSRSGASFDSFDSANFSMPFAGNTIYDDSVAKIATEQFPTIGYTLSSTLDRRSLKKIGIVVFDVITDPANDNKISFVLRESFVGSLDRLSRDPDTGASDYIGNVVNTNSSIINVFSNIIIDNRYKNAQTYYIKNQDACVMGFLESERKKHITYTGSIVDPLNIIFQKACDPNQVRIDVVNDSGVSNVAAFAAQTQNYDNVADPNKFDICNADSYPFLPSGGSTPTVWNFFNSKQYISKWYSILKKYDDFCKSTRRDCIFVADMFRPVVLDGNEKVVRNTNTSNTIQNTVVNRLKYVSNVNSSWSAGYSNWFYTQYGDTGDFFWCPPSIKASGIYVYTDAYYHPWDAPAGIVRGTVRGAYDVSYNPMNDEAGRIYQQAWNYAISYPMEGITLEGQKTFQLNKTALDRVNVRRLMIWLEKRVTAVARRFLYEGNTSYIRQRFVDTIKPIFEEAKNGYGITDYAIRCDDALNTDTVVDNNELRCVIAVKPVKTIEFIKLNFIITNQSANVSEEVMK